MCASFVCCRRSEHPVSEHLNGSLCSRQQVIVVHVRITQVDFIQEFIRVLPPQQRESDNQSQQPLENKSVISEVIAE